MGAQRLELGASVGALVVAVDEGAVPSSQKTASCGAASTPGRISTLSARPSGASSSSGGVLSAWASTSSSGTVTDARWPLSSLARFERSMGRPMAVQRSASFCTLRP
ncbi:hypothetical protein [Nonomuraea recticatena]|uniref:Secreted protein n=1 Tax=Nonomuraea recticatena TaxID=46178 RepID=A0ABN3RU70_9ACTN